MMNLNTIRFNCTNCGAGLQADARAAGFEVECPGCGEILTVPGRGPTIDAKKPAKEEPAEPATPPVPFPVDRLQPKVKFCISCSKDVPEGDLICPHCGGGRFGRL